VTSAIDPTKPATNSLLVSADMRANFLSAYNEISALQVGGVTVTATGATTARTLAARWGAALTPQDFGALGDGTTDDTAAVASWWTYVSTHGVEGYVPAGTYKLVGQVTWDIGATNRTKGVKVTGAGPRLAVFSLTTTSSPALLITNSNSPGDTFYCTFRDFGITTAVAGTGVRIGLASFADPFNSSTWDNLVINNTSTSASAIALETNYLCNCHINAVANSGGHGTAVKVNHSVFTEYRGAYDSADIGLNLATDYTYGCTFQAIDFETVAACVQIDSANASKNTFIGGTFVYTGATCLIGNAGSLNWFINPNISGGGASTSGSGILILNYSPANKAGDTFTGSVTLSSGSLAVSNGSVAATTTSGNTATLAGGSAGNRPTLTVTGADTNAGLGLTSKGTGSFVFKTQAGTSNALVVLDNGAAASTNYPEFTPAATGNPVLFKPGAASVDANSSMTVSALGTGTLTLGLSTNTAVSHATYLANTVATGLTAAGNSQGTALALTSTVNVIGTAAASTGVILPTAAIGAEIVVINRGANTLSVYPPTSGQIDAAGTNAAVTLATTVKGRYVKASANQWYAV
jgi:hypothetical protein